MRLERKYFWILFILFSFISIAITYTAYTLANTILIRKHRELYQSESSYVLSLAENELDQLNSTFDFLANNELIQDAFGNLVEGSSDYEVIKATETIDSAMSALNTFDLVTSIQVLMMKGSKGQEYWYGLGNNYSENRLIHEDVGQLETGDVDFVYLRTRDSYFRMSSIDQVLQFVQYIHGRNGENKGYLFFELNPAYFEKIFGEYNQITVSDIYFVDNENKILYSNVGLVPGQILDDEIFRSAGSSDIVVKESIPSYGWHLIIRASKSQITKDNRLILQVTLLTAVASIILELLAILLIIRHLFKPIKTLSGGLHSLSQGDFDTRITATGSDEIGMACKNFNNLADTLQDTIQSELDHQLKLKDSEYKALQSQINPHFLYNSLHALKWMASVQEQDNITKMVDALWQLFKAASRQQGQFVSLQEEVNLIEAFVRIQQVRYRHKFQLELEVDMEVMDFEIPKMILQPLIENAIFHGIAPKTGDGTIELKAKSTEEGGVIIEIIDDGVGMSGKKIQEILKSSDSPIHGKGMNNIAVFNIIDRLQLLYGASDLLAMESWPDQGTRVSIRLPKKTDEVTSGERSVLRMREEGEEL